VKTQNPPAEAYEIATGTIPLRNPKRWSVVPKILSLALTPPTALRPGSAMRSSRTRGTRCPTSCAPMSTLVRERCRILARKLLSKLAGDRSPGRRGRVRRRPRTRRRRQGRWPRTPRSGAAARGSAGGRRRGSRRPRWCRRSRRGCRPQGRGRAGSPRRPGGVCRRRPRGQRRRTGARPHQAGLRRQVQHRLHREVRLEGHPATSTALHAEPAVTTPPTSAPSTCCSS